MSKSWFKTNRKMLGKDVWGKIKSAYNYPGGKAFLKEQMSKPVIVLSGDDTDPDEYLVYGFDSPEDLSIRIGESASTITEGGVFQLPYIQTGEEIVKACIIMGKLAKLRPILAGVSVVCEDGNGEEYVGGVLPSHEGQHFQAVDGEDGSEEK